MADVSLIKDIGFGAGLQIISCKAEHAYPTEADGCSTHTGVSGDSITIHLTGTPDETAADAILTAIQTPTCTASTLTITVNVGTYIVADDTVITDVANKFVKVSVAIDDSTGDLEVLIFEKVDMETEYGAVPAGKTLCADLKEYKIESSVLVEQENFID